MHAENQWTRGLVELDGGNQSILGLVYCIFSEHCGAGVAQKVSVSVRSYSLINIMNTNQWMKILTMLQENLYCGYDLL